MELKVNFVDDLHLEWGYQVMPGGDVLILAGDICEAARTLKDFKGQRNNNAEYEPGSKTRFRDFFEIECAKYNKVFYVMGNHEHYNSVIEYTVEQLRSVLPSNITILQNTCEEYKGVVFIGSTLWTNLNNNNPLTHFTLNHGMNDFRYIKRNEDNAVVTFLPADAYDEHTTAIECINTMLKENSTKPCVLITHHAPTLQSIHPKYANNKEMNGGYASDCTALFYDNPNLKFAVHGHIHHKVQYNVSTATVLSNPRGYSGYEDTTLFDPAAFFTIETDHE